MLDLPAITNETRQLMALLDHPKPSCASWHHFVHRRLHNLRRLAAPVLAPDTAAFAAALAAAGSPAPWRIREAAPALIIAADGAEILQLDPGITISDSEEIARRALGLVSAVNAAAGFKAVVP